MARDYAKKKRSSTRTKRYEPRVPAWVWLFTGSILGAFIVFLMNLTKIEDAPKSQLTFLDAAAETTNRDSSRLPLGQSSSSGKSEVKTAPSAEPQPTDSSNQITHIEKPKSPFSFPTLLRDAEVKVPEGSSSRNNNTTPVINYEYSLQVASFRDLEDAEHMRAELILLNMDAKIEAATVRDKETWHRVVVGPFTSRSRLSKARSTLISNNYSAQVRKRTIPG